MTIRLSLRSGVVFAAALLLMVAGIVYAVTTISRGVSGFVRVTADISVDEALALYEDVNGQPQTGGTLNSVDFGTVDLDPFGNPSQPSRLRVWVRNGSNTTYRLTIDDTSTGDGTGDDTFAFGEVLFALSGDALSTAPTPAIVLASGDLVAIDLGLEFTDVVTGDHEFTVRFRAQEAGGASPAPPGMVAWWPGDGNANDIVGGNDGTLQNGVTFTGGKVGQAFSFDGVNDFVDISSGFNLGNRTFSFDMWIRYEDAGTNGSFFVWGATVRGTPSEAGFSVGLVSGQIVGDVRDERGQIAGRPMAIGQAPEPGVFHHVALVLDREDDRLKLYINGTQAAFDNIPEGFGSIDNNVRPSIGAHSLGGVGAPSGFFNGLVDEVELFDRALTAAEIKAIYDAGSAGKSKP